MKTKRLALATVVGALMLAASPARAADFTFNVPLDFSSVHENIAAVIVRCWAMCGQSGIYHLQQEAGGSGQFFDTNSEPIAQDGAVGTAAQVRSINPATGELHETVAVGVSAGPGFAPNNVGSYVCAFRLRNTQGQEAYPNTDNDPEFQAFGGAGSGFGSGFEGGPVGVPTVAIVGQFDNPAADPQLVGAIDACEAQ